MINADSTVTADSTLTADGFSGVITADATITCDSDRATADGGIAHVTPVESGVSPIHGPGRKKSHAKEYNFLDQEYWRRISTPPAVVKTIAKVAKKVAQKAPNAASTGEASRYLIQQLEQEKLAWDAFYENLLKEQIDRAITIEIQAKLIQAGLINAEQARIAEEDEERAILELLMEM